LTAILKGLISISKNKAKKFIEKISGQATMPHPEMIFIFKLQL
jgi:hypothetical protein